MRPWSGDLARYNDRVRLERMAQKARIVKNHDLTAKLYGTFITETHNTDARKADGGPVAYVFPDEQQAAIKDIIASIREEVDEYATTVERVNKDTRFSEIGRDRVRVERARLAASNIRKRAADPADTYGQLADAARGRVQTWAAGQIGGLTETASRDIARPFLAAQERDEGWLETRAEQLTDQEWAAVALHGGRHVSPSGEIRGHVTDGLRWSEAVRRAALAGRDDVTVWRRYHDAAGVLHIVTNWALALLKRVAGPKVDSLF